MPGPNQFFIVVTEHSVFWNVPKVRDSSFVDLSSLVNHEDFYWNFFEINQDVINTTVIDILKSTYLISRVNKDNIMHILHDDFIGLYHTVRRHASENDGNFPDYAAFGTDQIIQFFDESGPGEYDSLFSLLSNHPLRYRKDLVNTNHITRFEQIYVGNSKLTTWYQYGFHEPQGPIKNKEVSGYNVRQAVNYIKFKLQIPEVSKQDTLVLFSRTKNRLILNEIELLGKLSSKFNLKGEFIRNEDHSFENQVKTLQRTKIAVGMHGSLLIMSLFMPPGSILIELYPFAVPPENYTPYKTLAGLPGNHIVYRSWANTHTHHNIMHPEYPSQRGGVSDLPADQILNILQTNPIPSHICCSNKYWLFRVYQDTIVDLEEIFALAQSAIDESKRLPIPVFHTKVLEASALENCKCIFVYKNEIKLSIRVTWGNPWNGVQPDYYEVWETHTFKKHKSQGHEIDITDPDIVSQQLIKIMITGVKDGVSGFINGPIICLKP
jgi:protein O-mannose beta-1,4-N-acetylglucosaminyltransferase